MGFRVILSFMIITFISYLFSSDKTPVKPPTIDTDDTEKPISQELRPPVNKIPDTDVGQEGDPFPEKSLVKDIEKTVGSVYEGEIGKKRAYVRFDRASVIKGIIMSEVLQKPKSLKR